MRAITIFLVFVVSASLLSAAGDDGNVGWVKGYPKAGAKAGQIVVKGTAKAQSGFTLVSASAQVWPEKGGELKEVKVRLNKDGTFGATTVSGLDAGSRYNVTVEITEIRNLQVQVRKTDPKVVKAP